MPAIVGDKLAEPLASFGRRRVRIEVRSQRLFKRLLQLAQRRLRAAGALFAHPVGQPLEDLCRSERIIA
ncbi:MAG: hypothetical protein ACM3U2_00620, partial [Deltaproteobacteria bacterium]